MPEAAPRLFDRVPKGLFGPLGDPYAELYWELLASLYQHEFEREPFVVLRQVALELAEYVISNSALWPARRQELEVLAKTDEPGEGTVRAQVSLRTLSPANGSAASQDGGGVVRTLARRLLSRLEESGWVPLSVPRQRGPHDASKGVQDSSASQGHHFSSSGN